MTKEAKHEQGENRLRGAIEDIPVEGLVEDVQAIYRRLFDDYQLLDDAANEHGIDDGDTLDGAASCVADEYNDEKARVLAPFPALQALSDWLDPALTDGLAKLTESIDKLIYTEAEREIISTTAAVILVALSARLTGTTFDPKIDEQSVVDALGPGEPAAEALPSDAS